MKKMISIIIAVIMVAAMLTGCFGKPAVNEPIDDENISQATNDEKVLTGLSVIANVSKSKSADAENEGTAQADITMVAVTVGNDGVIYDCVIDAVQTKINFDNAGKITTDLTAKFESKNELGNDYGLKEVSGIGKEWSEQAAAMADYAVGKTVQEIKGISVNENGAPTNADLASSVTISITDFISGIEEAVKNAEDLGAKKGDKLTLASVTTAEKSKDASADEEGVAQAYTSVSAATIANDKITSCRIDAVEANVKFGTDGKITTDLTAQIVTKNQLGEDYGLKEASSIGKEWNEQAAAFASYVTGKTADEVNSIAVDERTSPIGEDLVSSVTIAIGDFQALIAKAFK